MIKCPNCSRDNASNFNFCLDCGYDLKAYRDTLTVPPSQPAPVVTAPPAAVSGTGTQAAAMPPPAPPRAPTPVVTLPPLPAAPPPAALPMGVIVGVESPVICPACGHHNAAGVRFCGSCGKRVDGSAVPEPAQPQRTMFMHAAELQPTTQKLCKLVTIDQSGREGMSFTLRAGETLCGRVNGIVLLDDPFVSPSHCRFAFHNGALRVIDLASLNGVYLRVRGEHVLTDGDHLRIGRQLFRFEGLGQAAIQVSRPDSDDSKVWGSPQPGAFGRLVQILEDGRTGEIRLLAGDRCQLGRETGDIVLPSDGFISGKHCAFTRQGEHAVVQDLGSSNGTYLRVRGESAVQHGDFLLLGNQMLRVEII